MNQRPAETSESIVRSKPVRVAAAALAVFLSAAVIRSCSKGSDEDEKPVAARLTDATTHTATISAGPPAPDPEPESDEESEDEDLPTADTSSASAALDGLRKACEAFLQSGDRGQPADAVAQTMSELKEAMKHAEEVTGKKQTTFAEACGIPQNLVRKIMGEGAKQDVQLAEEIARAIQSTCARAVAEMGIKMGRKSLDTSECDGLPSLPPRVLCKEEVGTQLQSAAQTALTDAMERCDTPSDTPLEGADLKQLQCIADTLRSFDSQAQAALAQCDGMGGESHDECALRVMRAGKEAMDQAEAGKRKSCPQEEASKWGLDWSDNLAEADANVKVGNIMSTEFGIRGGHLPSVAELEKYLHQVANVVVSDSVGTSNPAVLDRLGLPTARAAGEKYVVDIYKQLKVLIGKLPPEKQSQYQDLLQSLEIMAVLNNTVTRGQ